MQINTRSRAAIAAIMDVAVHGMNKPVALADISKRQGVSLSYLEQLFQKLRRNGFVASYRGPGGGYQLKQRLATISVADIINTVDRETFDPSTSKGTGRGQRIQDCVTNGLWCRISDHLYAYLRSVSLESLLATSMKAAESHKMAAALATTRSYARKAPLGRKDWPAAVIA